MSKKDSQKIKLGVFIILGTFLLLFAIYLIGNNKNMFSNTFTINTVFMNVNGLQEGNNVRYSGINIGIVKSVEMENNTKIRVTMSLEEKMLQHIKKDAIASIGSDGLVGNMIINITPGNKNVIPIVVGDEITSYSRIGTEDILKTLNTTNDNAAILISDFLKITQSIMDGKGILGKLLNDTIMANNLQQTIKNLKYASREANSTIKELNSIIHSIDLEKSVAGKLLNDSIAGQKIDFIIKNIETSSVEIEKASYDLNNFINKVSNGDGVLNYLANDSIFVKNLDKTIQNLEQGTDKFNENMEALKHHALFRGYFRRLEKKQMKEDKKNNNEPSE